MALSETDVATSHGSSVGVAQIGFAQDLLTIGSKRVAVKLMTLALGVSQQPPPTIGRVMVAFIQDDHIEEVMSHLAQPSIAAVGNLLNIGYHKVALKAVSHTSRRTIKNGCERTCGRWLDHSSGTPKTVCTGGIHRSITDSHQ